MNEIVGRPMAERAEDIYLHLDYLGRTLEIQLFDKTNYKWNDSLIS